VTKTVTLLTIPVAVLAFVASVDYLPTQVPRSVRRPSADFVKLAVLIALSYFA